MKQKHKSHKQYWWNTDWVLSNICKANKAITSWNWVIKLYHTSPGQNKWWPTIFGVGTDLTTYAIYKYLKQMTNEKLNKVYYQPDHIWTGNKAIKEW